MLDDGFALGCLVSSHPRQSQNRTKPLLRIRSNFFPSSYWSNHRIYIYILAWLKDDDVVDVVKRSFCFVWSGGQFLWLLWWWLSFPFHFRGGGGGCGGGSFGAVDLTSSTICVTTMETQTSFTTASYCHGNPCRGYEESPKQGGKVRADSSSMDPVCLQNGRRCTCPFGGIYSKSITNGGEL